MNVCITCNHWRATHGAQCEVCALGSRRQRPQLPDWDDVEESWRDWIEERT